ncbi:flagellar protein MotY [Alteromonas sp. a30]|uniref:flagellar protein MotY n=1 Tax=Alteromonas sp. a30 TaxID=2730917 RepID=UPI002282403F|nr:OmpA family protein [Alteromonas sp. a30]MCY7296849.1 OmpA family protein [Alteromonas sp. a30]
MRKYAAFFPLSLMALFSVSASAHLRQYSASVDNSVWSINVPNRLECTLTHNLPGYGKAIFSSVASKHLNMEFTLEMRRLPKHYSVASVYSVPPAWMPGEIQRPIAEMVIRKQYDGDLPEQAAWTMLSELEKGYWPTLYYQDWYNQYDNISVSLNASNFALPYESFVNCVSNLLPFSFEDIAYTVLTYKSNAVELTKASKKKLDMIAEYLKEDTDLELVLLDGYADSYGGRAKNKELSVQRAVEIKSFFRDSGVAADRIQVTGHGERRHIAPNITPEGRAKNRRVVIRLQKA